MTTAIHNIVRRIRRRLVARRLPRNPFPVPAEQYRDTVFVVGDSHVSLFSGLEIIQPIWPSPGLDILPALRTFHLGPVLAYSLDRYGSASLGREKLEAVLTFLPPRARMLLSFGEIDCRAHLLKGKPSQKELSARLDSCHANFMQSATRLNRAGFRVSIYNVVPSTPSESWSDAQYPVHGTCRERNEVTRRLNGMLKASCETKAIGFLCTFEHFVDAEGRTDPKWFMDPVHLNQRALPLSLEAGREIFSTTQPTPNATIQG